MNMRIHDVINFDKKEETKYLNEHKHSYKGKSGESYKRKTDLGGSPGEEYDFFSSGRATAVDLKKMVLVYLCFSFSLISVHFFARNNNLGLLGLFMGYIMKSVFVYKRASR